MVLQGLKPCSATNQKNNKNKTTTNMSQNTNYYVARRQQNWSRNQNTTRFQSAIKLGPVAHTVLVALMIIVLGLIYVTQATRTTGYDYEAQKIDSQIAEYNEQKSELEVESARLTALETIKNSSVAKEMTSPADTQYVQE